MMQYNTCHEWYKKKMIIMMLFANKKLLSVTGIRGKREKDEFPRDSSL